MALALLGLGEAAPAAFPVQVTIEARGTDLNVAVDGQSHPLNSALGGGWDSLAVEQPGPLEREYQIDGSDTTATTDRQPDVIRGQLHSPFYALDAWLRDESSYSRWEKLTVVDLTSGEPSATGAPLPAEFRINVGLRRPESAARIWLVNSATGDREGLELERDRRNARWLVQRSGTYPLALPRWFFPEQPLPFAAELAQLIGRSAAAGYVLAIIALGLSRVIPDWRPRVPRMAIDVLLALWLVAAGLVTTRLYHQLPHILDAVSYTFQAGLFASGQLALPAPPLAEAFRGPFQVDWQGRIFSQYPPGAPAIYALGQLVSLEWLVGPLACLALLATTTWTASALFGRTCAVPVLLLGVLSPFVLFQAGSFLSHPIAAGLLAAALAAFVAAECGRSPRWYAACGALLGVAFLTRETASVLFALPLGLRLLFTRRWAALLSISACGIPFVALYVLYNLDQTGSPFILPRMLFDATDHFGFGDGVGFHMRHTLAAGLANTDELLTLLQFELFGWPPLFALGLLGLPFLLGRPQAWDFVAAGGFAAFVIAYTAYFYHGIALGPRYYFEAMPWLLLLTGRGVQSLIVLTRSHAAAWLVLAVLSLSSVLFYIPAELQRRADLSGQPNGTKLTLGFLQTSLFGPRLMSLPDRALVLTDDWWTYNTALAALNCPRLPDCPVLFALATRSEDADALIAQYPGRTVLKAVNAIGQIEVIPY